MRLTPWILVLALSSTAALAGTPVYRYVDKEGVTHYTDKPPTPDAKPADLPPLQTIGPMTPLPSVGATGGASAADAAPALMLSIVSPEPDETFRNDDGKLAVSARSDRPVPDGTGFLFLLDGTAQNDKPSRSMSYTMDGVERGSHLVAVAAVDGAGKEIGRSPPVIVHMKPPTIDNAPKIPKPVPKPK